MVAVRRVHKYKLDYFKPRRTRKSRKGIDIRFLDLGPRRRWWTENSIRIRDYLFLLFFIKKLKKFRKLAFLSIRECNWSKYLYNIKPNAYIKRRWFLNITILNILYTKIHLKMYFIRFIRTFLNFNRYWKRFSRIFFCTKLKLRNMFRFSSILNCFDLKSNNTIKWDLLESSSNWNLKFRIRNLFVSLFTFKPMFSISSGFRRVKHAYRIRRMYSKYAIWSVFRENFLKLTKSSSINFSNVTTKISWALRVLWRYIRLMRRKIHQLRSKRKYKVKFKKALLKNIIITSNISYGYMKSRKFAIKKKSRRRVLKTFLVIRCATV